ncbi:MAG: TIGR01212 family radical SAM protein [Spirochaetes bacterium RIFOXYC1_FULL_54_7]|nr:MAG: TIGR01212 family radical SAM protein [Spirochaetes bacterium RIFOXYC1_FULL_54_7]
MHAGSRINRYADYLREHYGCRVRRVPVDAGFGCPNRQLAHGPGGTTAVHDGKLASGCSYCDATGSRAPILGSLSSVKEQVSGALAFLRARYSADRYLLYFQANTSTYAPVDQLRTLYDATLALGDFMGLIVSTRPDCLDKETVDLLAAYKDRGFEVWVELGLQSACDETLVRIGRGHEVVDFSDARQRLGRAGIAVAAHVIFGLPGEGLDEIMKTARFLAGLGVEGIKIHDLHYCRGTALLNEVLLGELPLWPKALHLEACSRFLELMPGTTTVMRLCSDNPPDRRALPRRQIEKASLYRELEVYMENHGTWQGRLFKEPKAIQL